MPVHNVKCNPILIPNPINGGIMFINTSFFSKLKPTWQYCKATTFRLRLLNFTPFGAPVVPPV